MAGDGLHHEPQGLHENNKLQERIAFAPVLDLLLGGWDKEALGDQVDYVSRGEIDKGSIAIELVEAAHNHEESVECCPV